MLLQRTADGTITPLRTDILMTPENYAGVLQNNGVEESHVETLDVSEQMKPLMFAAFKDNEYVLIDGNHRAVKAYRQGRYLMPARIYEKSQWEQCLVDTGPLPSWFINTSKE